MNEDLVLHILNTACYGLNLHFSLVPQAPYLYIFFDRSPEAVLDYAALTETLRLAAASAGLPPEYEYLALYGRILGEEHPDWETAIYLYQSTLPAESTPQEADLYLADQSTGETPEILETPETLANSDPSHLNASDLHSDPLPEEALLPPEINQEDLAQDLQDGDSASFEALFSEESTENFSSVESPSSVPDQLGDEFQVDPTIVFEADPDSLSPSPEEPVKEPLADPTPISADVSEKRTETIDIENIDIDNHPIEALPLPPPPPRHLQKPLDPAQVATKTAPPAADDMSQFYFRAKPKPKAAVSPTEAAPSETLPPVPEAEIAATPTSSASPTASPQSVDPADLSGYCFIRNKLMLSSSIKPPFPEVITLISTLHRFGSDEKMSIAPLLDKLYRQPEKTEEGSGEAVLYQPGDINLDGLSQPLQDWMQGVLALEPESFRKSAIWFSRYFYNPTKTIAELGITPS